MTKKLAILQKLYTIAHKYYIEGKTQQTIADELGINRVQVSRYLKEARKLGIVKIELSFDSLMNRELEKELLEKFKLKAVGIVPLSLTNPKVREAAYALASQKIEPFFKNNQIIGIGWGSTMENLANNIKAKKKLSESIFIPLTGGTDALPSYFQANNFVKQFADAYEAHPRYLYVPFVLKSKQEKDKLLSIGETKKVLELWKKLDVFIAGIGCKLAKSPLFEKNILVEKYLRKLIEVNVVGDVLTHFFDINGQIVYLDFHDLLINISLEDILKTKWRIGIAAGMEKVQAIIGALRSSLVNVLITDIDTAKAVLDYVDKL